MSKSYFVCANSSGGFVNFFPQVLCDMEKVYIIKGGPGTGKSTMMKKIGEYFEKKSYDAEYIRCSSDPKSLDGVIIRELKVLVADGTAPHVIEPTAPGAIEEYVCLSGAMDSKYLKEYKNVILAVKEKTRECYDKLYDSLKEGKKVHDSIEKIYIEKTDFHELEQLKDILSEEIFRNCEYKEEGNIRYRFFGALTSSGAVNYIEELTESLEKRYLIKGRAGTGKSTFLKGLIKEAEKYGTDVEVYHCSFDPDSLDMVIFPELNIGIFDSTAPHEIFPSRENDIILDFYETAVEPGTDERNKDIIRELNEIYNQHIKTARECLKTAQELHKGLEKIYINAMDFKEIDRITERIICDIENM
ncbi:MAG: PRK06851 family protein [Clostridia bacterium]|nr:PRK06851 family protein [Clostridia bacterium]